MLVIHGELVSLLKWITSLSYSRDFADADLSVVFLQVTGNMRWLKGYWTGFVARLLCCVLRQGLSPPGSINAYR